MAELLATTWSDSSKRFLLHQHTILDYFCQKTNPFYDATCNNEMCRMQRRDLSHLENMEGVEYVLSHLQEPDLFIICKQHREPPKEPVPIAYYTIIDGTVYQCPDLLSIINSRLTQCIDAVQQAYIAFNQQTVYHPLEGNVWSFEESLQKQSKLQTHNEASIHQQQAVDVLLKDLIKKFPPVAYLHPNETQPVIGAPENPTPASTSQPQ